MKNSRSEGDVLTLVAPSGGVVSGVPVLIGGLLVVPQASAAVGELFAGEVRGVLELSKVSAQAWSQLVKLYWDDTAKLVTTVTGSNTVIGVAAAVADNPSATGLVRLDGVVR